MSKKKIIILASGSGSNAENIANYFHENEHIELSLIASNNRNAYVLERAKKLGIPSKTFNRAELIAGELTDKLNLKAYDLMVLAGFMMLIPEYLLQLFPDRIVNIHPALLPKFGGKGMYGHHVHEAVINQGEKESGITIHLVNEKYDEGKILFQAKCQVSHDDTPDSLAAKIHELEYAHYPRVIAEYLLDQ